MSTEIELLNATMSCLVDDNSFQTQIDSKILEGISSEPLRKPSPQIPAHRDLLSAAIAQIDDNHFSTLKMTLTTAKDHLHWKIDDGGYYAAGADVGEGYKAGNMHCLLVGPENALILSQDVLLGFFLLAPWTLYRDHKHHAPEIYIPLTGPSGWRFDLGQWEDHHAGSRITNAPNVTHATRVYETPFLAIFAWMRDINSNCSVVKASDWTEIEKNLHHQKSH